MIGNSIWALEFGKSMLACCQTSYFMINSARPHSYHNPCAVSNSYLYHNIVKSPRLPTPVHSKTFVNTARIMLVEVYH